jgi:hypothetical protein
MIRLAKDSGLFQPLGCNIPHQTSLYADDVVLFLATVDKEIQAVQEILSLFECATKLSANYSKSQIFLINRSDLEVALVTSIL